MPAQGWVGVGAVVVIVVLAGLTYWLNRRY
jgi:hypothetical protein